MTETNYPAWQKAIREAQAEEVAYVEAQEALASATRAALSARYGQDLAHVLDVAFGIQVEAPPTNSMVIDGFEFWLKQRGDDISTPVYSNRDGSLTFTMNVNVVRPNFIDREDDWPASESFICRQSLKENHDWTYLRACLANSLDELRNSANHAIAQKKSAAVSRPEKLKPTLEQLIKSYIAEAVAEAVGEATGEF